MSNPVDIFRFEVWAGSARGFLARPILPTNIAALREHIASITYDVYNITDGGAAVSGVLDVNTVMMAALTKPWKADTTGYSLLWDAPGTLWPLAAKQYRIVLTFTTVVALGSKSFIEVWEATTKSPTAF
jgi:hypothetical protein